MKDKILFPMEKIVTTKFFSAAQDWEVPISGFFIIAPLRKIKSIEDFSEEESLDFIKLIKKIRQGMRKVLKIKDVYLFQNEDTYTLYKQNFHLWMFPRHKWMEKFGREIQSVKPILEYAKKNKLKEKDIREVKESVKKMRRFLLNY